MFLPDTCVLFWGYWYPLFWISADVSSEFQSQSGFCLIHVFCGGECNVHFLRSFSGTTPADLLAARTAASSLPHKYQQRWDLAHIRMGNHPHKRWTRYPCASVPALKVWKVLLDHFYQKIRSGQHFTLIFQGIPNEGNLKIFADVVNICTNVIFTCSAHHASVNSPMNDMYIFPPNMPLSLKGQPPKNKV